MTLEELKRVNKMFFAVKGHLFPIEYTTHEMRGVYNSYFKRLWGNHERFSNIEDSFEEVWKNRKVWLTGDDDISDQDKVDDIEKVAELGYD